MTMSKKMLGLIHAFLLSFSLNAQTAVAALPAKK